MSSRLPNTQLAASSAEWSIPFNAPIVLPSFSKRLDEVLASGQLSGMGPLTASVERQLHEVNGAQNLLVGSATAALEMMGLLSELKPGDEVIVPAFSFVSTANAFALRGARLRFADNDQFGNIQLSEVERLLTPKTKAVVALHYGGCSADMETLTQLCRDRGVLLLEDAAQAIGAKQGERSLGTFGALACYSFHETKNVGCGEGGCLIVNDEKLLDYALSLREKGTNRRKFVQGLVDKYSWVSLGSNYVLSELNVCLLGPQLEALPEITERRRAIWMRYHDALREKCEERGIEVLGHPSYNTPNYHLFALVFPKPEMRSQFIAFMRERGILTPFHYVALHTSPFGAAFFREEDRKNLPVAEHFSDCLVRLPLFFNLEDAAQEYVIESCLEWQ